MVKKIDIIYIVTMLALFASMHYMYLFDYNTIFTSNILFYGPIFALLVFISCKDKNRAVNYQFMNAYSILLILMLIIVGIYSYEHNGLSMGELQGRMRYFIVFFFAYGIIHIFYYRGERFWNTLNNIAILWYSILIIAALVHSASGTFILPESNFTMRNEGIRTALYPIGNLLVIYNFWKIIKRESVFKNWLSWLLGVVAILLVQQTRAYTIVFAIVFLVMTLMDSNKKSHIGVNTFCLILVVATAVGSGYIDNMLQSLFGEGAGTMGQDVRIDAYAYMYESFFDNIWTGLGFRASTTAEFFGRDYYFNDIGIVGLMAYIGIWAILLYGLMLIRFAYITFYAKKTNADNYTLLFGFLLFLLGTSATLICYWDSTAMVCPIIWAVMEVYHSINRKAVERRGLV